MGIARSTCYDAPKRAADDTALVEAMHAIKDDFEAYGWRRMQAALGQQGWVVNHKKLKRLMREHGLNARRRRRYVATTDSDHDQPLFPNRTRDMTVDGPDQLWVADLTYVAVAVGFVYVALIMDAWSRRIIGYAMSRRIDARLTLAALNAAIALRQPSCGCVHHSDRGSQYAAETYRNRLQQAMLVGSMGRRGNPYDNAMMESLMKTLKVEGVYPLEFETAEDVAEQLPAFIEKYNANASTHRLAISALNSTRSSTPGHRSKTPPDRVRPEGPIPYRRAKGTPRRCWLGRAGEIVVEP